MIPSLTHTGKVFHYHGRGEETSTDFKPADLGIDQSVRAPRIPGAAAADANDEGHGAAPFDATAVASAAAVAGMAALARHRCRSLAAQGIELCLAEVKGPVMDRLAGTDLGARLKERIYLRTHDVFG